MNHEKSRNQLRQEFDKPPSPELKPKLDRRYSPEKRMLPGRPAFGAGSQASPIREAKPQPAKNVVDARKQELEKQLVLEERSFKENQKRELELKKERLADKQVPERFSIQNELTDIAERRKSKEKLTPANMLYRVSGQKSNDDNRVATLELREKQLDQEFSQSLSEFEQSQEIELLRFEEVIAFYRAETEQAISELSHDAERAVSRERAPVMQHSEGRSGR